METGQELEFQCMVIQIMLPGVVFLCLAGPPVFFVELSFWQVVSETKGGRFELEDIFGKVVKNLTAR